VPALRAHGVSTPVIFLTARDAVPDQLAGFNAGGDDYLAKPFALAGSSCACALS
jgi:two-component system response regulator MprA